MAFLGNVTCPRSGQREHRGSPGQAFEGRGDKGLEKAFAYPWPAGLLVPQAEGGGIRGRVLLARLPQVFPAAQAEPVVLEG